MNQPDYELYDRLLAVIAEAGTSPTNLAAYAHAKGLAADAAETKQECGEGEGWTVSDELFWSWEAEQETASDFVNWYYESVLEHAKALYPDQFQKEQSDD